MRDVTLCLLRKKDLVLLGMKKRGFGKDKYNGFGGKVDSGETIEQAAVRELYEEVGVKASELEKVGKINYIFPSKPEWNQLVHLFFVNRWEGEPKESEEMTAEWFEIKGIPFDKMWQNDAVWMPKVLDGEKIQASVIFNEDNESTKEIKIEKWQ